MAESGMSDNSYAMLTHLSPLAGYIVPFGNIIAPLVLWLIKRDQSPFIERIGREALNFQITVMLAVLLLIGATIVTLGIGGIITIPLIGLIALADLIMIIVAAIEANKGNEYRFPICLRLVPPPPGAPAP